MLSARKLLVRMLKLEYAEFFAEMDVEKWGQHAEKAKRASDDVRTRLAEGLEKAYSALTLATFARLVGLSEVEARGFAIQRGWTEDGSGLRPPSLSRSYAVEMDGQLEKLTKLVGFLEAHSWK